MKEAVEAAIRDVHTIISNWRHQNKLFDYVQLAGAVKTVFLKRIENYTRAQNKQQYWRAFIRSVPMIILTSDYKISSISFPDYDTSNLAKQINEILKTVELNPVIKEEHEIPLDVTNITNIKF